MKLLTFEHSGRTRFGTLVREREIVDLSAALPYASIREVLAAGALDEARRAANNAGTTIPLGDVVLLPVIPDPGKIICAGLNYENHRLESGRDRTEHPVLFGRYPESQVGAGAPIIVPRASERLDFEGELALVIGRQGRAISPQSALEHVAGYACYNDASVRDFQRHTHQYLPGKNFDGTGAFGPWMVTTDEIPDPTKLTLVTRLNGIEMQRATTDDLTFDIPALIAYASTFTTLRPGDVIVTGTPGGVGAARKPPLWMKDGDVVEVEISGIGILRNPIEAEVTVSPALLR